MFVSLDPDGTGKTAQTNESGVYSFPGLKPGTYTVRVTMPGFAPAENAVDVKPGATVTADIPMRVALETQKIEVQGDNPAQVSTDPTSNAGAVVLRGEDLEALSDDPDELASDLQALAGPAAGPNGGQIFIDGFSGAQLPPKESIREIRINQNPSRRNSTGWALAGLRSLPNPVPTDITVKRCSVLATVSSTHEIRSQPTNRIFNRSGTR